MVRKLVVLFIFCICLFLPVRAEGKRVKQKCGRDIPPVALQENQGKPYSHAQQKKQNSIIKKQHLSYIQDRSELKRSIALKGKNRLVLVSDTTSYYLSKSMGRLDPKHKKLYHYARTWVKLFLDTELTEGHRVTSDRFKLPSLVRTNKYQKKLRKHDPDAGAIAGKKWWQKSSHLTGSTVDISFKGLSPAGFKWLQERLIQLQAEDNKVVAVQENCQGHFHVFISPLYQYQYWWDY